MKIWMTMIINRNKELKLSKNSFKKCSQKMIMKFLKNRKVYKWGKCKQKKKIIH